MGYYYKVPTSKVPTRHQNNTNGSTANDTNLSLKPTEEVKDTTELFLILLFINIIITFFDGSLIGFIDTGVLRKIELLPYKVDYGLQRMFGAFGFVSGLMVSNLLVDKLGNVFVNVSKYTGMIINYSVALFIQNIIVKFLYKALNFTDKETPDRNKKEQLHKQLLNVCLKPSFLFFLATVFVNGIQITFHFSFLVLYLQELNAPNILFTLCFVFSSLFGVIGFRMSSKVIKLFRGTWNVFIVSFASFVIRYFIYSVSKSGWIILATEPMHAIGFNIFLCAAVHHIKIISPPSILTTMYGILYSFYMGIASIVGNIIGGYVYQDFGGRILYGGAAGLALVWVILIALYVVFVEKKICSKSKKKDAEQLELSQDI